MRIKLFAIISTLFFPLMNAQDALLWKFQTGSAVHSSPLVQGNSLYCGSGDKYLYALNRKTGEPNWKYETNGKIHSNPVVSKNSVLFSGSDGYVYSVDKKTGKLFWKYNTGGEQRYDLWDYYLSSPVVENGIVYFGSGDSAIHAISIIDGRKLWSFKTNGIIHATPLVKNGLVCIGSYDGTFYALQAKTGNLIWKFKTEGEVYFPKGEIQKEAALFDTTIIFGSRDYFIYSLDANTGSEKWRLKEKGSWVIATPLVYKDNIYVGTSDSHSFYSINKNTGVVNWKIALPMRVYGNAVQKHGIIYFGCFDGILRGVDAVTGCLKWSYQTKTSKENYSSVYNDQGNFKDGFELYGADMIESENKILKLGSILSTPAIDNEIIYFGATDGGIYAVKMNITL